MPSRRLHIFPRGWYSLYKLNLTLRSEPLLSALCLTLRGWRWRWSRPCRRDLWDFTLTHPRLSDPSVNVLPAGPLLPGPLSDQHPLTRCSEVTSCPSTWEGFAPCHLKWMGSSAPPIKMPSHPWGWALCSRGGRGKEVEEGDGLCPSWLGTSLIQGAVREQSTPGDGRGLRFRPVRCRKRVMWERSGQIVWREGWRGGGAGGQKIVPGREVSVNTVPELLRLRLSSPGPGSTLSAPSSKGSEPHSSHSSRAFPVEPEHWRCCLSF